MVIQYRASVSLAQKGSCTHFSALNKPKRSKQSSTELRTFCLGCLKLYKNHWVFSRFHPKPYPGQRVSVQSHWRFMSPVKLLVTSVFGFVTWSQVSLWWYHMQICLILLPVSHYPKYTTQVAAPVKIQVSSKSFCATIITNRTCIAPTANKVWFSQKATGLE